MVKQQPGQSAEESRLDLCRLILSFGYGQKLKGCTQLILLQRNTAPTLPVFVSTGTGSITAIVATHRLHIIRCARNGFCLLSDFCLLGILLLKIFDRLTRERFLNSPRNL
ncbi:hypothetical protein RvY_16041-2 [Ramazzottius varieornatus]|uniref:Uncharacterized protein n=1 Tax=Ramazzottius varieornatus TaxID=947166 RepID=A0A1D1VX27_RAMVA|nr:hypothetical protein RvY_16041-2 [Ramazzottius varieornatus]